MNNDNKYAKMLEQCEERDNRVPVEGAILVKFSPGDNGKTNYSFEIAMDQRLLSAERQRHLGNEAVLVVHNYLCGRDLPSGISRRDRRRLQLQQRKQARKARREALKKDRDDSSNDD